MARATRGPRVCLQERDGRDVAKSDYQRLAADHSKLERQKNTLLAAFRWGQACVVADATG